MSLLLDKKSLQVQEKRECRYREATTVAGTPSSPIGRGGGGGGILCMYYGCENEAKHICPYCYLLFCDEHKDPEKHQCNPLYRELVKLRNIPELKRRLAELGEEITESPRFEYLWKQFSRRQLFQKLASVAPIYREFFQNFIERALTTPYSITDCDVIMFIYARLVSKLLEFSEKYGKVIVMDHGLLEALSTGNPPCDRKLAGRAFQWWLTLELLDVLYSKRYVRDDVELFRRKVSIIKDDERFVLYLDSNEVTRFLGLRPDILSTKGLRLNFGKVIEVKLSYKAFRDSWDQIVRYMGIWGSENIVIAIGLPPSYSDLLNYYVKIIDSIVIMDNENLQKTIDKFIDHLTSL